MKYLPFIIFTVTLFNFVQTQSLTNNSIMADSSMNNNNSITLAGASIGLTTGTSMLLLSGIAGEDVNLQEAITIFLGPSFINGIVIPNYLESQKLWK